jgi:hypothetical protein
MNYALERPERRRAQRFRLALPVELAMSKGITRDLSVCGVFFETDQRFVLGEIIEFTVVLEYLDPSQPVRLQCRGRVIRLEQHNPMVGVAVSIQAYRFEQPTRLCDVSPPP